MQYETDKHKHTNINESMHCKKMARQNPIQSNVAYSGVITLYD